MPALLVLSLLAAPAFSQQYNLDVARVARLHGASQRNEIRPMLSRLYYGNDKLAESVFYFADRLRPTLRSLLRDPKVGEEARFLLALIAVPEDLRFMIRTLPRPRKDDVPNGRAYGVACSLITPETEEEWSFLRKCALNEYNDRWVDAGAIQTLKLIASPRSREILEEAQKRNPYRAGSLKRALEYIQSNPPPLAASNLEELADRVAHLVQIGDWEGNAKPWRNEAGDRALVDFHFATSMDGYIYTATFHQVSGLWKLCGVRETLQMFQPRLVQPRPASVPLLILPVPDLPPPQIALPPFLLAPPKPPPPPGQE